MIWSIRLTPWALPSLLAVLLVVRDASYLWPRRREPTAVAILFLAVASGVWAVAHLLLVVSPSVPFAEGLTRTEDVAAAVAPVAWLAFALTYARRHRELHRWPMGLLYLLSVVVLTMVFRSGGREPWHLAHVLIVVTAVAAGTVILVRYASRVPGSRLRGVAAVAAALMAIVPTVTHVGWHSDLVWMDLSPAGFGIASAVLEWGLLRERLLNLGPVARTLVMVELQDPIVVLDGRGQIVDVNRAAETVLGLRPYGDVPVPLGTLWASSRREEALLSSSIMLHAGGEEGSEPRIFEVTPTSLDRRGAPGRTAMLLRDVTTRSRMERELIEAAEALRKANEDLERLAKTDSLTGLANRRAFLEALEGEIERSSRYERPLSLVLLDLDHFKKINDAHGHAAGDEVLRAVACVLEEVCRDVDVPARLGGEELALLLPETGESGARVMAERIRERIERGSHRSPAGQEFRVTASLGVASVEGGVTTPEALLQRSDEAMYQAKSAGRNRVEVAAP